MESLEVRRFIADCKATGAEATVVSAAGTHAFYPSKVKYHHVHPLSGSRDLLGAIMEEARRQDVKIIARIEFLRARAEVFNDHPEWFVRDAMGQPVTYGDSYATCALGGYRNEDFAFNVIRELQERYGVHGFHLNGAFLFHQCHCKTCELAFGGPLPKDKETTDPEQWRKYQFWRQEVLSGQLAGYYRIMRDFNREAFFMGELIHDPSIHIPALARRGAFSQYLFTVNYPGDRKSEQETRLEVPWTCDQVRSVAGARPAINLKLQMIHLDRSRSYMSRAEYFYDAYQAIAHGAGLKLVTVAVPQNVLDARILPDIGQVFNFMRRQQAVLDTMEPIVQVALLWPDQMLLTGGAAAAALKSEVLGLYTGLKMRHACLGLLRDEHLLTEPLAHYDVIVVPTAVGLTENQAAALTAYVEAGGRLVLLDSPQPEGIGFEPMPNALTNALGGIWTREAKRAPYAALTMRPQPNALAGNGPIPLTEPYRRVTPPPQAQVWFRDGHPEDVGIEETGEFAVGTDPIVFSIDVGKGAAVYVATGIGQIIGKLGHVDHVSMLETLVYHGLPKRRTLDTNAPSTVTVTLAHWRDGRVVHLVNGTGQAPLDEAIPVGPIDLDIAWDGPVRAELAVPGQASRTLSARRSEAGRLQVTLPRLEAYAQVVMGAA
jgi:hypothetical protein